MKKCFLCNNTINFIEIGVLAEKPKDETDFGISMNNYYREIWKCEVCGVYNNFHQLDMTSIYAGQYNASTYHNQLSEKFNKIMSLPFGSSDNKQRVKRISGFYISTNRTLKSQKVLDIGSGLCVFLAELKKHGVISHCIDPDRLSINNALENAGVEKAIYGHFEEVELNEKYDFISLNKVLEHLINPNEWITKIKTIMAPAAILYIEVPDGEEAMKNGLLHDREEFFIEHFTVFSKKSLAWLAKQNCLTILNINTLREPSGKYTVFGFFST